MIEYIAGNYLALIEGCVIGGLIVGPWIVARNRRKAVERLVKCIENVDYGDPGASYASALKTMICYFGGGPKTTPDAPGRVIARSVKRVTKDVKG